MRKYLLFLTLLPLFCFGQTNNLDSIPIKHKLHKHPLPLTIIGITVLSSKDADGQKFLGNGFFDPNEGHGGARYYWDVTNNVQIKYVIGVDKVIDNISVTKSDYSFENLRKENNLKAAKMIDKSLEYSIIGNITLGDNPAKIINQFGVPNKDSYKNGYRVISYIDNYHVWKEVLFYEAIFTFQKDKLLRIEIYNGE